MSVSFLARFKIKPELEAAFVALIPPMEANAKLEPATLAYKFYRLKEPHWFAVFESFVDEDGDKAHQSNPANADIIEKMIECMDGGYAREYLYELDAGN
jgi:(4S)-4-hydroxy-5-phosphonooxypentane-2,3-dione isomerase